MSTRRQNLKFTILTPAYTRKLKHPITPRVASNRHTKKTHKQILNNNGTLQNIQLNFRDSTNPNTLKKSNMSNPPSRSASPKPEVEVKHNDELGAMDNQSTPPSHAAVLKTISNLFTSDNFINLSLFSSFFSFAGSGSRLSFKS